MEHTSSASRFYLNMNCAGDNELQEGECSLSIFVDILFLSFLFLDDYFFHLMLKTLLVV
jgi:hypothetical protein